MAHRWNMPTILVVGSLNMDLVTIAPRIPIPGETLLTAPHAFLSGPGGKGANQAFALSRLAGQKWVVQMVGMVGEDEFGKEIIDALEQGGVNVERIGLCTEYSDEGSQVRSGVAIIILDSDTGQNRILVTPGANFHLLSHHIPFPTPSDFPPPLTPPQAIVLQQEIRLSTLAHSIALYHQHCIPVILNPAPAFPLSTIHRENVDYSKVSYLIPNESEAAILLSTRTDPDIEIDTVDRAKMAATEILSLAGVREAVVITLGALGAVVSYRSEHGIQEAYVPARKVPVVDTTAAGDTFVAAFALDICRGRDVLKAVKTGIKASSLTVQRRGAIGSIPGLAEVDAILDG